MPDNVDALARWESHKIVRAGKILSLSQPGQIDAAHWVIQVKNATDQATEFKVKPEVFARGIPEPGSYFVVYEDGYQSWSPAAAFEKGYARLP